MSNIIDSIRLSGTTYQIQGGSITVDTELDSGSTNPVENRVIYNKIDEVEEVTAAGLNALNDELGGKQDTLISGTNIKTINNESILGSGNIDIQSGGKAIEAGRGISITTGETADTVSFNLPISAGTGTNSVIEGSGTQASGNYGSHAEGYNTKASGGSSHAEGNGTTAGGSCSHAEGLNTTASGSHSHAEGHNTTASNYYSHAEGTNTTANGYCSHAEGQNTQASGQYSHAEGLYTQANSEYSHTEGNRTIAKNSSEHASGQYNNSVSASTTFGDSGNTLFSVGNGTSSNARHNAFEIRQNGDIYLTKDGQDVKLQDQLGGGSITVDTALDSGSTNPVQNRVIYNKIDEVEEVTAAGLNALNDKINPTVELTQAEYDALTEKDPNTYYIITDAQAGDLTNYYTKSETNTLLGGKADTATTYTKTEVDTALASKANTATTYTKTEVDTALASKANTATTYTKTEVDNLVTAATSTKQDTLVSGTNIKTINNQSLLGSGNIDIQGGGSGKAVSGGTNISITTGETADTINCTLPIKIPSNNNTSIIIGNTNQTISSNYSVAEGSGGFIGDTSNCSHKEGLNCKIGNFAIASHVEGNNCEILGNSKYSHAEGNYTKTANESEHASGQYNVSSKASTTFGNSGNTLFSVGNGTSESARHNAFEIRQNGDIYCSDGTNDVKLQDTITATTANTTALGGLSLVKLTQAEYDALATKDSSTLYIVTDS